MVELDFVKEIEIEVEELQQAYIDIDSRELQNKYMWQIEILREIALPQAKIYHWNLNDLSVCSDKKTRYIEQLQNEIRMLKGGVDK